MKNLVLLLTVILGALLSACTTLSIDGVIYASPDEARRAKEAEVRLVVDGVIPSTQKIPGSLRVVLPTVQDIQRNGVTLIHGRRLPILLDNETALATQADVLDIGFLGRYKTVERGAIFDRTTYTRSAHPDTEPIGDADYKLWLVGTGPTLWQWYLSTKTSGRKVPVSADAGLQGSARENSFNDAIVAAALQFSPPSPSLSQQSPAGEHGSPPEFAGKSGTGFFVNDGGFAVTNAHVVDGCLKIIVLQTGGEPLSTTIIAADRQNDLALVRVEGKPRAYGQFRAGPAIRQGEPILIYGYPLAGALASTGNLSVGNVTALAGLGDDTATLQISAPVQPGNSGGPVVDESGLVVGVVQSKLDVLRAEKLTGDIAQNVNFAIKASVLTSFLDANGVSYKAAPPQQKLSTPDLGDRAKAFTFRLSCTQ